MIDIKTLRESPNLVKESLKKRGLDGSEVDKFLEIDEKWRQLKKDVDALRARRNKVSQSINQAKKKGEMIDSIIQEAKSIPSQISEKQTKMKEYEDVRDKIWNIIPNLIDESVPDGANWHQELLNQMSTEIPGVRPAAISVELKEKLEEYRGFRHVVRNVYTYHLDPNKLKPLVKNIKIVMKGLKKELSAFARFIQKAEENKYSNERGGLYEPLSHRHQHSSDPDLAGIRLWPGKRADGGGPPEGRAGLRYRRERG